ncbi:bifunctional DNA-binding transcriptional regulator/O6-methylguanine-DNA methyltransferase Ada [Undibacterium terreum]|uniref:Regulatory protein of adaptive response n=1 Tax=Undibacterium terreum TaxID=1224302 RepID=A0A916U5P8_9BURK|nr:bifunctional DNA-binding transcriptional regulator/O6-methylguanine-DNA methyltransferase Ada [Undibacterium terreum]GGC60819.1 bifunctional transcriptional activator/DNA repair enzyme protein Ada [Undibacterium terreum]
MKKNAIVSVDAGSSALATLEHAGDAARWVAVQTKDAGADGQFYYAVRTTGVYCRPSCASRPARRENVLFYDNREEAEAAGFRPCKRCKPDQAALAEQYAATIAQACKLIEAAEQAPSLTQLADAVGMSQYHFHRIFKAITGVTPKAYATAHRGKRVRQELGRTDTVTQAIYDAGFNSNGRFYASSTQVLGMTPSRFRAGGAGTEIRFALGECSLGTILVAATEQGVCAILLGNEPDTLIAQLQDSFPRAVLLGGDTGFEQLVAQVVGFVEAPALGLDLPLDVRGTAFQQRVWQALREIPAGTTVSYRDVAERIGAPKAMRAVAQACAANKIAVAIPCHRVVRNDGVLSGYRWGVERKRSLLDKETRQVADGDRT